MNEEEEPENYGLHILLGIILLMLILAAICGEERTIPPIGEVIIGRMAELDLIHLNSHHLTL